MKKYFNTPSFGFLAFLFMSICGDDEVTLPDEYLPLKVSLADGLIPTGALGSAGE